MKDLNLCDQTVSLSASLFLTQQQVAASCGHCAAAKECVHVSVR